MVRMLAVTQSETLHQKGSPRVHVRKEDSENKNEVIGTSSIRNERKEVETAGVGNEVKCKRQVETNGH